MNGNFQFANKIGFDTRSGNLVKSMRENSFAAGKNMMIVLTCLAGHGQFIMWYFAQNLLEPIKLSSLQTLT